LKREELECLPHQEKAKPMGFSKPTRCNRWTDVADLAYRKAAMLAGVSGNDEADLLAKGKKLFAEKDPKR
jgi:hypothetical protein